MKLSLCIATFNEEANIHYALDSAYDFVDEVIIVDGGSEDKTLEIARSYGDKVRIIQTDNPPMFHINKQKSLDAATGDWILQLDADEAVSPELKKEIVDIVQNPGAAAFWIPRKNLFLNRFLTKGGQYPDYTIRLYKRGAVRFPCKNVHENVELVPPFVASGQAEDNSKKAIKHLKNDLLHYADPDFSRYLMRWNRYTSLDAQLLINAKKHLCFPCYFIGKPISTFFMMYFRHLGLVDGFPGFVFALFSAIRFWVIYIKVYNASKIS